MSESSLKGQNGVMEFAAFFAADMEPERVHFSIAGQPAWVELQKMESSDHERFMARGLQVQQAAQGVGSADIAGLHSFLVSRTVKDFCLKTQTRDRETGGKVWIDVRPPAHDNPQREEKLRAEFVEANFRCNPEAWGWLVQECYRVNGLAGETEKN